MLLSQISHVATIYYDLTVKNTRTRILNLYHFKIYDSEILLVPEQL